MKTTEKLFSQNEEFHKKYVYVSRLSYIKQQLFKVATLSKVYIKLSPLKDKYNQQTCKIVAILQLQLRVSVTNLKVFDMDQTYNFLYCSF